MNIHLLIRKGWSVQGLEQVAAIISLHAPETINISRLRIRCSHNIIS
jgi:hypothetical protein